jgi:two-component system response regulator CpxR
MSDRLLIVDDDTELCALLKELLEPEDFDIALAHDGETGLSMALSGEFKVVILDIMLPKMNGLEVLRQIRAASSVPVILLTARGDEIDRIVGLEVGADDYLPKPFHPRELVARLRAILRRAGAPQMRNDSRLCVGDVEMDFARRSVTRGGVEINLTTVEFNILAALLRAAGSVVSREETTRLVLGHKFTVLDRSVDVHVSKIRKKLSSDINRPDPIKTLRGIGYLYVLPEVTGENA